MSEHDYYINEGDIYEIAGVGSNSANKVAEWHSQNIAYGISSEDLAKEFLSKGAQEINLCYKNLDSASPWKVTIQEAPMLKTPRVEFKVEEFPLAVVRANLVSLAFGLLNAYDLGDGTLIVPIARTNQGKRVEELLDKAPDIEQLSKAINWTLVNDDPGEIDPSVSTLLYLPLSLAQEACAVINEYARMPKFAPTSA